MSKELKAGITTMPHQIENINIFFVLFFEEEED